MILAAGMGTRLKPITDKIPKALVEVNGVTMLERLISSLKKQGFNYIVVNTCHFSDQIKNFLKSKDFGVEIELSDETDCLLDTGGGITKAFSLLYRDNDNPVLFHNVDILSNADLKGMINYAGDSTVVMVSERETSRKLIFDAEMKLTGWHDVNKDIYKPEGIKELVRRNPQGYRELAFSGIYVMSKASVEEMRKLLGEGKYSVMEYFLHPERKEPVSGLNEPDLKLIDIGKPETLQKASEFLQEE